MKNAVIIGASSGIGAKLAELSVKSGYHVLGTYNDTSPSSNKIEFHHLNVMDIDPDLSFLPDQIDCLAYCPGSINLKPFGRIRPEQFTEDFQLQVVGAVKVIQASLPALKKSDQASVVLFSTVAVQLGFNFHTQVATSKGALEGLTRSLATELAPHIRVNCIAPSLTDTPLASKLLSSDDKKKANADRHPLKKIGAPEDIAEMAAFLLSEKASWITGQIIHVDGGMSAIKG